jgi:ubiquinone/menaquinone biosynthesis C-methylase UbiE
VFSTACLFTQTIRLYSKKRITFFLNLIIIRKELSTLHAHAFYHDEKERRKWQNPEAILADIGLKPGFTFIDVGCGEGFFTLPAARIVGRKGKVYGLDIYKEAIDHLREKALKEELTNLNLTLGSAESTILCERCADIVFFGIDLHDFRDPAKVLANARGMLKPTGYLVDLDWKKEPMELGPPVHIRFSEEEAAKRIEAAGFRIETVKEAGPYHYIVIARP